MSKVYINENIVLSSIVKQLNDKFNKPNRVYEIYKEQVPQGFKKPSFHVRRILLNPIKEYQGTEYKFLKNVYNYIIRYFPKSSDEPISEINDIIDDLRLLFKDVIIYNNNSNNGEEEIITSPVHIRNMTAEVIDEVLQFNISFNIRTVDIIDIDKVKALNLLQNIKEG